MKKIMLHFVRTKTYDVYMMYFFMSTFKHLILNV